MKKNFLFILLVGFTFSLFSQTANIKKSFTFDEAEIKLEYTNQQFDEKVFKSALDNGTKGLLIGLNNPAQLTISGDIKIGTKKIKPGTYNLILKYHKRTGFQIGMLEANKLKSFTASDTLNYLFNQGHVFNEDLNDGLSIELITQDNDPGAFNIQIRMNNTQFDMVGLCKTIPAKYKLEESLKKIYLMQIEDLTPEEYFKCLAIEDFNERTVAENYLRIFTEKFIEYGFNTEQAILLLKLIERNKIPEALMAYRLIDDRNIEQEIYNSNFNYFKKMYLQNEYQALYERVLLVVNAIDEPRE